MDDNADARVTKQTVIHLHTLAIEQHKRMAELERNVRDIKAGIILLMLVLAVLAYRFYFPG